MHAHSLDAYRARTSFVHDLDARTKLIMTVFFIVSTAVTPDGAWPAYILLAALSLSAAVAAQLGIGFTQRRAALVLPFTLAAVVVPFTTPGSPLLTVQIPGGRLVVTDAGLVRFTSLVIRAWLSVQLAVVLTASTPFRALLQGMRGLGLPRVLVAIAGFAYRYLFVIGAEARRMLRARRARSGVLDSAVGGEGRSVLWRARVTGGMAGSLFIRSLERSERVYNAMVARGYDGEVRTLGSPSLRRRDWLTALSFALVLTGIQALARVAW
ncbi:MAG: cobalt ECF transporter T component CbiQ [Anaerolineae bacterium]